MWARLRACSGLRLNEWVEADKRMRGQSTMEYAIFVAVVAAALIAMSDYVRRSVQANLKATEDQLNTEAATGAPGPGMPVVAGGANGNNGTVEGGEGGTENSNLE